MHTKSGRGAFVKPEGGTGHATGPATVYPEALPGYDPAMGDFVRHNETGGYGLIGTYETGGQMFQLKTAGRHDAEPYTIRVPVGSIVRNFTHVPATGVPPEWYACLAGEPPAEQPGPPTQADEPVIAVAPHVEAAARLAELLRPATRGERPAVRWIDGMTEALFLSLPPAHRVGLTVRLVSRLGQLTLEDRR